MKPTLAPASAKPTVTIVSIGRCPPISSASLLATVFTSSRGALEAEVLEGLGCGSVEGGSAAVVAPALGEVALRDPGCGTVRTRRELRERVLGFGENALGLLEPVLLEERAAEDEA